MFESNPHIALHSSGRLWIALAALVAVLLSSVVSAESATYYIGQFSGSVPADDPSCGTGKGSGTAGHPCATVPYWNANRRNGLANGDVVRLAPGTYKDTGAAANTGNHCIIPRANVTYEGRTAADGVLDDHESVVIDVTGTDKYKNPCGGKPMQTPGGMPAPLSGFVLRDMKMMGGSNGGGDITSTDSSGVLIDRVRFTKNAGAGPGLFIGKYNGSPDDPDCVKTGRLLKNVTVVDSEFDNNTGTFGGISLGCMDGFTLARLKVHDNRGIGISQATCMANPRSSGCDDLDGVQFQGAINGTFSDSEVWNNGEDNVDVGGHPAGKSHHIVIERVWSHDSPGNFKASGAGYVTFRSNLCTGPGNCFTEYGCAHHVKLYNNTFWGSSGELIQLWQNCYACEFVNNIFRGNATGKLIFVDRSTTAPTTRWENNIIINDGTGPAIAEDLGAGECSGVKGSTVCEDPSVPCPSFAPMTGPNPLPDTPAGLAQFQAGGDAGEWFGSETGNGEKWGTAPAFKGATGANSDALHLLSTDTVALDAGLALTPAFNDYDNAPRPAGPRWDIGADEAGSSGVPSAPSLISVDPIP